MYRVLEFLGYPKYRVGRDGSVWSYRRQRWKQLKGTVSNTGHIHVSLCNKGIIKVHLLHRLILLAFVGPCPEGMECCHNNGNPVDNRVENLRWDTPTENSEDAIKHGRRKVGEKSYQSKLSNDDVREIRKLRQQGWGAYRLGKRYGVSTTAISYIFSGKTWKHVK